MDRQLTRWCVCVSTNWTNALPVTPFSNSLLPACPPGSWLKFSIGICRRLHHQLERAERDSSRCQRRGSSSGSRKVSLGVPNQQAVPCILYRNTTIYYNPLTPFLRAISSQRDSSCSELETQGSSDNNTSYTGQSPYPSLIRNSRSSVRGCRTSSHTAH